MFLDFFNFEKKKYRSPASRQILFLNNNFKFMNLKKKLTFFKKWKSGRNDSGKIVHFRKKSLLVKNKKISINYNYRYFKIGVFSNFFHIPFLNKILILIFFSNGSFMYINSTQNVKIFSFYTKVDFLSNYFKFNSFFAHIFQIKKLSVISLLELLPQKNAQYVRSSGTFAKIIKFDNYNHTALIQLPSQSKKFFSKFSLSFLGKNSFKLANKIINTKSGYWRMFGSKSVVRGVAKNPVDHPHGGRTKSIKLPRTPWGKVTKLK